MTRMGSALGGKDTLPHSLPWPSPARLNSESHGQRGLLREAGLVLGLMVQRARVTYAGRLTLQRLPFTASSLLKSTAGCHSAVR